MQAKTYKRELALAMLLIYFGLVIAGMFVPEAVEAAASMKYEVFGFAAIAFGMDAYAKQVRK